MFSLQAPSAKDVRFASDVFGWDRPKPMQRAGNDWHLEVQLPEDVRIEYQFVVDGTWSLDPLNPVKSENGFGGFNSCYMGPAYRHDVPDQVPEVPMRRISIRVTGHGPERVVTVYVPEGDHEDLPVMVYADGKDYEQFVKPQFVLQNLRDQGRVPPVALVLVPPCDRMQEYWKNSEPYELYIVEDVLPAVRAQVKAVSGDPQKVFVGGASLGGLISMRIAQHFPDQVAGGVHSQSGAFWASPGVFAKSALLRLNPAARLFIEWGRYEGVLTVSNDRMTDALRRIFRDHETAISSEGHNWTAWQGRFARGVEYLLEPFNKP